MARKQRDATSTARQARWRARDEKRTIQVRLTDAAVELPDCGALLESLGDGFLVCGGQRWRVGQQGQQLGLVGAQSIEPEAVPAPAKPEQQAERTTTAAICARCRHYEPNPINPRGGLGACLVGAPAAARRGSLWPWPNHPITCNRFENARHE